MNRATVERLNRINLEFYRDRADEFDRTRQRPWDGWTRVLDGLETPAGGALSVLDVGCGNARLASALAGRFERVRYVGLDSESRLLQLAADRVASLPGVEGELVQATVGRQMPSHRLGQRGFDLVAAFGLFHHIPSHALRRELLTDLTRLAAPGGVVASGFWQFGALERFRRRLVDWQSFNRGTDAPLELDQLEKGDHLLAWGDRADALRYCHWTAPAEVRLLLEEAGVDAFELFEADGETGRLNLYALIRVRSSRGDGNR